MLSPSLFFCSKIVNSFHVRLLSISYRFWTVFMSSIFFIVVLQVIRGKELLFYRITTLFTWWRLCLSFTKLSPCAFHTLLYIIYSLIALLLRGIDLSWSTIALGSEVTWCLHCYHHLELSTLEGQIFELLKIASWKENSAME